jgi:long-chain acyl-CoA synthetase
MENSDLTAGTVGKPMTGVEVALVDWGEYKVSDKPRPRGEIILSGAPVASGYFCLPEQTSESFIEQSGQRWFRTGDIGEFIDDQGTISVSDNSRDDHMWFTYSIVDLSLVVFSSLIVLSRHSAYY